MLSLVMAIFEMINLQAEQEIHINRKSVAIMGGTFDPIHNGHLRTAVEILDLYQFSELRLIPCFQPVHKFRPVLLPEQRLAMVEMASHSDSRLLVDDREINRKLPSYTIDTIKELRLELGEQTPLVMIVGMDSFLSFPTWKEWRQITNYAHDLVVARPNWEPVFVSELADLYENSRAHSMAELQSEPAGKVYMETFTSLNISSSMIRTLCRQKKSIAYLLPESVQAFIEQHKLYL